MIRRGEMIAESLCEPMPGSVTTAANSAHMAKRLSSVRRDAALLAQKTEHARTHEIHMNTQAHTRRGGFLATAVPSFVSKTTQSANERELAASRIGVLIATARATRVIPIRSQCEHPEASHQLLSSFSVANVALENQLQAIPCWAKSLCVATISCCDKSVFLPKHHCQWTTRCPARYPGLSDRIWMWETFMPK